MSGDVVAQVALTAIIGAWKATQLARSPQRSSLRWVVATFAVATAGFAVTPLAGTDAAPGPPWFMWLAEALLSVMLYNLICVFLVSAREKRGQPARERVIWQAVPLAATVLALAVIAARMPSSVTATDQALALFRFVGNAYTAYGIGICLVWQRRYARLSHPWLARGLTVASVGLAVIGVAAVLTCLISALRLAGVDAPSWLELPRSVVMAGNLLFLVGVAAPGARVRWSASQVWWRHLQAYHRLRPLWTLLHGAFPEDSLTRAPVRPWRDVLSLRGVHRRFYRRVIECRDGLVRASGHLPPNQDLSGPTALAAWLLRALAVATASPRTGDQGLEAHPVAIPADGGLDSDVRELVALSRQLRTK
ncbi:MAB_1171c family putative transporter [Kutzneria albida]|uniref:DUF6545 domain-containing protein n=1 Tax=Kutzneria albida DSM 43870 TaxID=1449976 RepID=W5W4E8_9PSEU|nr:MAB_1171c family putative transporter [Kutzneria albida]AHH95737.1 hypothetical protein KALB_2369 [Kutzneria albida DSM 43870]